MAVQVEVAEQVELVELVEQAPAVKIAPLVLAAAGEVTTPISLIMVEMPMGATAATPMAVTLAIKHTAEAKKSE